jgi:hypothetical protein
MAIGCGSSQAPASSNGTPAPVLCNRNLGPVDSGIPSETGPIVECTTFDAGTSEEVVPHCLPQADADGGTFWECCVQLSDPPGSSIGLTACR